MDLTLSSRREMHFITTCTYVGTAFVLHVISEAIILIPRYIDQCTRLIKVCSTGGDPHNILGQDRT